MRNIIFSPASSSAARRPPRPGWSTNRCRAGSCAGVTELAKKLMEKNPHVLSAVKLAYRRVKDMSWDVSEDYLYAKAQQTYSTDPEQGRKHGMGQFLDEKSYK